MKQSLHSLVIWCIGAALTGALASTALGGVARPLLFRSSDKGTHTLAVYDDATGLLTLVENATQPATQAGAASSPEWKYVSIRRSSFFDGRFLTAADFDGDGGTDLALPGYAANKVFVVWSRSMNDRKIEPEEFAIGSGPTALAPAQMDSTPAVELLVASTATDVVIRGYDLSHRLTRSTAAFPQGFALQGLFGFETLGRSRGAIDPDLAILHHDVGEDLPSLSILSRNPRPEYGPSNDIRFWKARSGHQLLIGGFPNGGDQPGWFLAYAPGSPLVEMFPAGLGIAELVTLERPIRNVQFLPDTDDEVLVIFENGTAERFAFAPGNGFTSLQTLNPPPGMDYAAVGDGGYISFVKLGQDTDGGGQAHAVFQKMGENYVQTSLTAWPTPPLVDEKVTVVLYPNSPFATPPPAPFETFLAGDWTTGASYSAANVTALVETFGGVSEGLGDAMPQALAPTVDPGIGAAALGNQWEPSSSLFYQFASSGDGAAAVTIQPPAGAYPNTLGVTFHAGADVTVHYRIDQGVWKSGVGPVWITRDASVQYYGQHGSGALSSIQTAVYDIDQALTTDSDGDSVPDVIENLAGTNPFDPDSDNDGESDFSEILGGTDASDPSSHSAGQSTSMAHTMVVNWDDDTLTVEAPDRDLEVYDLGGIKLSPATRTPRAVGEWRKTVEDGLHGVTKTWVSGGNEQVSSGAIPSSSPGFVSFVVIPPHPFTSIPVDLGAADLLSDWRDRALLAVEARRQDPAMGTVGPASTMAALLFEFWYGQRLVEVGLLGSVTERPRLADPPRSPHASVLNPGELKVVEALFNDNGNLRKHDLARAAALANRLVHDPAWESLRDVARSIYQQSVAAAAANTPLDPPLGVLRRLLDGVMTLPQGYSLPHNPAEIVALREQFLATITSLDVLQLTGLLSFPDERYVLEASGQHYRLVDERGADYQSSGLGLLAEGSVATVIGIPLTNTPLPGFSSDLRVMELTVQQVPLLADTDTNGNRIPDTWELFFLGGLNFDFWSDDDSDGFVLGEENAAGSDPNDGASIPGGLPATPRNLAVVLDESGNARVQWEGSPTADYDLWFSGDLSLWQPQGGGVQMSGDSVHFVPVTTTDVRSFFKLLIDIPVP